MILSPHTSHCGSRSPVALVLISWARIEICGSITLHMPKGYDRVDHASILEKYPWILKENQECIVSPDSDGLLCGLLMSQYLGWHVVGFYDTKVLALKQGIQPKDRIFLDVEIFRPDVRSVGQHMVMYDKNDLQPNWKNFENCIAPNNLRNFDFKTNFKEKYPFGTVHMLLAILSSQKKIHIPHAAVCPLLYTDGTFKNQFNYPDNCISWLEFLDASRVGNPLTSIFMDKHYSTYELMKALKELFDELRIIGGGKRGGDKIKLSDTKGRLVNIDARSHSLVPAVRMQTENLLKVLGKKTGWTYNPKHWMWGPYDIHIFRKASVIPTKARYNNVLAQNPISFAMTSRTKEGLQYTLDPNGLF